MSVSIATNGKFTPASGGAVRIVERIVYVPVGSSDIGVTARKPQVIISRVSDEYNKKKEEISVEVFSIEEE
jgi:hypothetical protein